MADQQFKIKFDIDTLFNYLKSKGYYISNPDCKKGNSFDIIKRGKQKIAGFDLLLNTEPDKEAKTLTEFKKKWKT